MKFIALFVTCLMVTIGFCERTFLKEKYLIVPGNFYFRQYSLNSDENYEIDRTDEIENVQVIRVKQLPSLMYLFWIDSQNNGTVQLSKITNDSYEHEQLSFVTPSRGTITDIALNEAFRYLYIASPKDGLFELNLMSGDYVRLSDSAVRLVKYNVFKDQVYFLACSGNGNNFLGISYQTFGIKISRETRIYPIDSCFTKWELDFEGRMAYFADDDKLLKIPMADLMSNSRQNLEHLATFPGEITSLSLVKGTLHVTFKGEKNGYFASFRFGLPTVSTSTVF